MLSPQLKQQLSVDGAELEWEVVGADVRNEAAIAEVRL
jgi:hypothetical protein